jgi:hypothetical protein
MLGEKQTKIRAREDGFPAVMKHKNIAPMVERVVANALGMRLFCRQFQYLATLS